MKWLAAAASMLLFVGAALGAGDEPTGPGAVKGFVRGPEGGVLKDALVAAILYESEKPTATVRTGEGGRFQIENLPAGTYGLTATFPERAAAYRGGVEVHAGQETPNVELSLGTQGITLSGRLRDPAGKPVPGGDVVAWRYSDLQGDIFQVAAAQDGRFEITLPEGAYSLQAESGGWRSKWTPGEIKEAATIDLELRPVAKGPPRNRCRNGCASTPSRSQPRKPGTASPTCGRSGR